jgi:hypothetical protein
LRFLLKLLLVFAKIVSITLVFEKNAIFFAENWQKSQKMVIITSTPGLAPRPRRIKKEVDYLCKRWFTFSSRALPAAETVEKQSQNPGEEAGERKGHFSHPLVSRNRRQVGVTVSVVSDTVIPQCPARRRRRDVTAARESESAHLPLEQCRYSPIYVRI